MSRRRKRSKGAAQAAKGAPDGSQNGRARNEPEKENERPKTVLRNSKANMVVLLDGDPDYVEMESRAIVNYIPGFNPMGFTVADKALSYISSSRNEGRIALVLVELEMPDGEGHSVREILEVLAGNKDILVAAVSAHNHRENVQKVLELGAVGLLPKAFTMEVFVRFIKNILRNGCSSAWQCGVCGRLVAVDQLDLLKMKPIKCSDKACGSMDITGVDFTPRT